MPSPRVALLRPLATVTAVAVLGLAGCKPQAPPAGDAAPAGDATAAAPAPAKPAVALPNPFSDPKDEIRSTFENFLATRSFHASMRLEGIKAPGGGAMTNEMDFVAPDRYRMQTPMGTQVIVGDTMYMSVQGRTMKVPMPKGTLSQWRDPAKLDENSGNMTVEAQGRENIDGIAARKYLVHNTQPQPSDVTLWVDDNGLPLQIHSTSGAPGKPVTATIRYSRYNDPSIRIEPPQ